MKYRKCVSKLLSSWLANWQWFFKSPIMARTQILVHRWGPEQDFRYCFADRDNFRLWHKLYQMWQMFSYLFSLSTAVVAFLDNLLLYKKNSIDKQDSKGARQIEASGSDNQSLSASSTPIIPSISNKSIKPSAACSITGARLGSVRTVAETATATVTTLVHPISSPSVAIGNVTLSVSFKIYFSFTI